MDSVVKRGKRNTKQQILFVPGTNRNAKLLAMYADGLKNDFDCSYLRIQIYGQSGDIGNALPEKEVLSPSFLNNKSAWKSDNERVRYLKSIHKDVLAYLKGNRFGIVVLGDAFWGNGRLISIVAREAKIPTLVCQEGARGLFREETPFAFMLKQLIYNMMLKIYYPAAAKGNDFETADYAAVWGEFMKGYACKKGTIHPENIWVVGNPQIPKIVPPKENLYNKRKIVLVLDTPTTIAPKGTFDLIEFRNFRTKLVKYLSTCHKRILYKPHPLTPEPELDSIRSLLTNSKNIEYISPTHDAKTLVQEAGCCITFPSTAVFEVLAYCVPLILLWPCFRGFRQLEWDPVSKFGAGILVRDVDSLNAAFEKFENDRWYQSYTTRSLLAAQEQLGPLDGKSVDRFAAVINEVMYNR